MPGHERDDGLLFLCERQSSILPLMSPARRTADNWACRYRATFSAAARVLSSG